MNQTGPGYVPELDGLRGGASLAVLIVHCLIGVAVLPPGLIADIRAVISQLLLSGVDLFFVLSGFLVGGILLDNRERPNLFKVFWLRRIARIFPANYLLLGSYVLATWLHRHMNITQLHIVLPDGTSPPLWTYATFTQNIWMADTGNAGPRWLAVTWSLAIEEQFYLFFFVAIVLLSRRTLVVVVVAAVVAAPVLRTVAEWYFGWRAAYVLLPCRMDALMFGVIVTMLVRNKAALALAQRAHIFLDLAILLLIVFLIVGFARDRIYVQPEQPFVFNWWTLKYSMLALLYALVVLRIFVRGGGLLNRLLRSRLLLKSAIISYGLYMYHEVVNLLLHGLVRNQLPQVGSLDEVLLALLVMATAIGLSTLSHWGIEEPARRLARSVQFEPICASKKSQATLRLM